MLGSVFRRNAVSESQHRLKQRVAHEVREYLVMSFYLFAVFSLFVLHRALILSEQHIEYTLHGLALINALALAKVMLVAQDLRFGEWLGDVPLIYPTLLKSVAFTVVLACFKIVEDFVVGRFRGESFHESLAEFGGGSWQGILTLAALVFVMLIPFFGFTELRRVFGADRLFAVFFRPRPLVNLPAPERLTDVAQP
jgi:hypothetical protein